MTHTGSSETPKQVTASAAPEQMFCSIQQPAHSQPYARESSNPSHLTPVLSNKLLPWNHGCQESLSNHYVALSKQNALLIRTGSKSQGEQSWDCTGFVSTYYKQIGVKKKVFIAQKRLAEVVMFKMQNTLLQLKTFHSKT